MPRASKTTDIPAKNSIHLNHFLYALLFVAVLALGYLFIHIHNLEETKQSPSSAVTEGSLPPLGNEDAKVTIIEFSDFQCPSCRLFFEDAFPELKAEYIDTGKVKMHFRHYPLPSHPMAIPSSLASECAADQNKFWEFHDKIFTEQSKKGNGTINYTNDDLKRWAQELALDSKEFNECFDSQKHQAKVDKDFAEGEAGEVAVTPTFFINGYKLEGAQPFTAFKTIIDQELNK